MEFRTFRIVDRSGNAQVSAPVKVYTAGTTTENTVYTENGVAIATDELKSDSFGNVSFAARNGIYDIEATVGRDTRTIENVRFFDPDESLIATVSDTLGIDKTGATDVSADLQALHDAGDIHITAGTYRIGSPIVLKSDRRITLAPDAVLQQRGEAIFTQGDDLEACHVEGGVMDYQHASPNAWHFIFKLKDHRRCTFKTSFRNYTNASLILRELAGNGNGNTVDNHYHIIPEAMSDATCKYGIVGIGHHDTSYKHTGDGTGSAIATGVVWPETLKSSVKVVELAPGSPPVHKTLTTDYTVSYDGSDNLTVTPTASIASGTFWWIDTSQPIADGRVPITGNHIHIVCDPTVVGYLAMRWVDGEQLTGRFRLDATVAGGRGVMTNPHNERSNQAGDFLNIRDLVLAYKNTFNTGAPVYGMDFGPGTTNTYGGGIRMDSPWLQSGTYYGVKKINGLRKTLTGTVSGTSGSPTVTGTGTKFTEEVSIIGAVKDQVVIDDKNYAVASIDSDTQITLSTNLDTSPSGAAIERFNKSDLNTGLINFAAIGTGVTNRDPGQVAQIIWNSASAPSGTATITAGNTFVDVLHGAWREPNIHEIEVSPPLLPVVGEPISVSITTSEAIRFSIAASIANDLTFGWRVRLNDFA